MFERKPKRKKEDEENETTIYNDTTIIIEVEKKKRGRPHKHPRLQIELIFSNIKIKSRNMDITIQLDHAPINGHINVTPSGAVIQNVVFTSSDDTIITVADNGNSTFTVTLVAVGTATLTATAQNTNGDALTATANITITPATQLATAIDIAFDNV